MQDINLPTSESQSVTFIETILMRFHDWMLIYFNKEGIFVFFVFIVAFFAIASIAAVWAIKQGEFTNIEEAKFEMLEEVGV